MSSDFALDSLELEAYQEVLERAAGEVLPAVRGLSRKYAGLIAAEAVRRAPERTGRLKYGRTTEGREKGIHVTPDTEAGRMGLAQAGVKADAPYSGFVEFGTRFMAPRPFLGPAFRKYRKPYTEELGVLAADLIGRGGKSLVRGQRERFSIEQQLVAGQYRTGV